MNSIYNLCFSEAETQQIQESMRFLNNAFSEEIDSIGAYARRMILRQQTLSVLQMKELSRDEQIASNIFQTLESKLCCFIENLYYSSKYNFHDLRLKALRDDSLYLTLSRNISINMFVDEEDFEAERDSNEEEIFLSYSKNGKDYITCDSISNIISIIENL